jgi:hypothetical protein
LKGVSRPDQTELCDYVNKWLCTGHWSLPGVAADVPAVVMYVPCWYCSELEVRKSGAPGRFVLDDPTKYPGKEDVGIFRECRPLCAAAVTHAALTLRKIQALC